MKNLYFIGGTMGVGKTTVSQKLKATLQIVFSLMEIGVGILIPFK
ncbi:MAG: hypothetical protein PHE51_06960 [Eubacteriales bacterium]|nr:hypothetical protein [Eubacteriales bacterium]